MAEVAPNGFAHNPSLTSIDPVVSPPPEIEATLSRLSAYRNVRGVMILSRVRGSGENTGTEGGIVQSSGAVFDGESGKKYAKGVEGIVESVGSAVAACENGVSQWVSLGGGCCVGKGAPTPPPLPPHLPLPPTNALSPPPPSSPFRSTNSPLSTLRPRSPPAGGCRRGEEGRWLGVGFDVWAKLIRTLCSG